MNIIMNKVYWSLRAKKYNSYDDFIKAVKEYNDMIAKEKHEWQPDKIMLKTNKLKVIFEAFWKNENDKLDIIIEGKDKPNISMGEILFKIHNESIDFFKDSNQIFFEGLSEIKSNNDISIFRLNVGS